MRLFGRTVFRVAIFAAVPLIAGIWIGGVNRCGVAQVEREFEASRMLKFCAAVGYPQAEAYLGLLYLAESEDNKGTTYYQLDPIEPPETTRERGLTLLYAASEKGGGGIAQNEIGLAYLDGRFGFQQDYHMAREWFEKALAAGEKLAAYNLARVYANGLGVDVNLDKTIFYLADAAKRRYCPASEALTAIKDVGSVEKLEMLRNLLATRSYPKNCPYPSSAQKLARKFKAAFSYAREYIVLNLEQLKLGILANREIKEALFPSPEACEVYRDFVEIIRGDGKIYVRPITATLSASLIGETADAPKLFYRDSGNTEMVEFVAGEPQEMPMMEEIEFDTSGFFDEVYNDAVYAIPDCFKEPDEWLEFWAGSLKLLNHKKTKAKENASEARVFLTIWSLSPVGLSQDGQYAILYAQYYCGPLCAAGDYYLLKRNAERVWEIYGVRPIWVS